MREKMQRGANCLRKCDARGTSDPSPIRPSDPERSKKPPKWRGEHMEGKRGGHGENHFW
jgi:hypothetical protein